MILKRLQSFSVRLSKLALSVPVRWKITGIMALPVLVLGFALNYWITTGLAAWLSYILSDDRIEAAMRVGSRSTLLVTLLAALLSVLLSMVLTDMLTQPILRLKKTSEQVAEGKFNTRAEVWANDEIGTLAVSLNKMLDHFDHFQENLARSNARLQALNEIALAADREAEIHDVLYIALEKLLELLGLPAGWVYLYDPEMDRFHLASLDIRAHVLDAGILMAGIPGQLCSCQQALVDNELGSAVGIRECGRLKACGLPDDLAHHISIPIEAREQRFGVINLMVNPAEEFSTDTLQWITSIGQQISEVVANAWLQMKLKEKEAARQFLLESLVHAQEEERSRLARELHDHVGQSMTSLLVRFKAWEIKCVDAADQGRFNELLDMTSGVIDDLRDLSYSLHPPALEELGLAAALETLGRDRAEEAGFALHSQCSTEALAISTEEQLVLYRIAQEALTNIIRHAAAQNVEIKLMPINGLIQMTISDDGNGFDPAEVNVAHHSRHLGLISMSERAELAGGRLDVYSAPGEGTTVQVVVPVRILEAQ